MCLDMVPIDDNEPQPPICFCCNVRSWSLFIAILQNVLLSIYLVVLTIFVFKEAVDKLDVIMGLVYIIVVIIFIVFNVKLLQGLQKRNMAPVRVWLIVNSALFIHLLISTTVDVIKSPYMARSGTSLNERVFEFIAEACMDVLCFLPLYQYYKYEKSLPRRNDMRPVRAT